MWLIVANPAKGSSADLAPDAPVHARVNPWFPVTVCGTDFTGILSTQVPVRSSDPVMPALTCKACRTVLSI